MVSEVRVWHYESHRLLWACPVVVDIEEDVENNDFIDRLVGVKHMEIAQSVLWRTARKDSPCTPGGAAWLIDMKHRFIEAVCCVLTTCWWNEEIGDWKLFALKNFMEENKLFQWIFC